MHRYFLTATLLSNLAVMEATDGRLAWLKCLERIPLGWSTIKTKNRVWYDMMTKYERS
jgi:hypothetical protein